MSEGNYFQAPVDRKFDLTGPGRKRFSNGVGQAKFSSILGGILCPRCFNFDKDAKAVLRGTLASIDYIEKSSWQKALYLKMSHNIAEELAAILNIFLNVHLDKEIKSRKFLI